ncbi:hypothetical protein D3C73_1448240 [compost metagenome]
MNEVTVKLPEIPQQVAEAIENIRAKSGEYALESAVSIALFGDYGPAEILGSIPFDTLMLALSVG